MENRRAMLSGGTLAILHAMEEAAYTTQALAARENTELSILMETIGKLKTQLTDLDNQVAEAQKKNYRLRQAFGGCGNSTQGLHCGKAADGSHAGKV